MGRQGQKRAASDAVVIVKSSSKTACGEADRAAKRKRAADVADREGMRGVCGADESASARRDEGVVKVGQLVRCVFGANVLKSRKLLGDGGENSDNGALVIRGAGVKLVVRLDKTAERQDLGNSPVARILFVNDIFRSNARRKTAGTGNFQPIAVLANDPGKG